MKLRPLRTQLAREAWPVLHVTTSGRIILAARDYHLPHDPSCRGLPSGPLSIMPMATPCHVIHEQVRVYRLTYLIHT